MQKVGLILEDEGTKGIFIAGGFRLFAEHGCLFTLCFACFYGDLQCSQLCF